MLNTIDKAILVNTLRKCGIPGEPYETMNKDGVKDCVVIDFYEFAHVALFFTMLGEDAGFLSGRGHTAVDTEQIQEFATNASVDIAPRTFTVYFAGWVLS